MAYDSNDEQDPVLLRRRTSGNWDGNQKWEIKISSGKITEGWEAICYDSNDEQDPFLSSPSHFWQLGWQSKVGDKNVLREDY